MWKLNLLLAASLIFNGCSKPTNTKFMAPEPPTIEATGFDETSMKVWKYAYSTKEEKLRCFLDDKEVECNTEFYKMTKVTIGVKQ